MVTTKFREAHANLERLRTIERAEEFYFAVNAFITAARSVLYVAQFHHGWRERDKTKHYSTNDERDRQKFDTWFDVSAEKAAVLAHPLSADRNHVIHHDGQAGFVHIPKPVGGLALDHGTPFRHAPFRSSRGAGLPLVDENVFCYLDASGTMHDALPYCEAYLDLVSQFFAQLRNRPWV